MTVARPVSQPDTPVLDGCDCSGSCCQADPPKSAVGGPNWQRAARQARWLAWASLVWMGAEGAIGLWQGLAAGSISLTGWALSSVVEGLASVVVIWRFTSTRALSETAEHRAQRGIAISFWLLAPYIAAESLMDLITGHHAGTTVTGIVLTGVALVMMPLMGQVKHTLATRLSSAATAGEGTQNYLCAAQSAGVLIGLVVTAVWADPWWIDPIIGLGIAVAAIWEGVDLWHGDDCCG
jgi:divalent metal cation (Fe/Co/Zn/Cd) transporter